MAHACALDARNSFLPRAFFDGGGDAAAPTTVPATARKGFVARLARAFGKLRAPTTVPTTTPTPTPTPTPTHRFGLLEPRLNPPRERLSLPFECYGQPFYRGWQGVSETKV